MQECVYINILHMITYINIAGNRNKTLKKDVFTLIDICI